ncbi:hypothetical protein CSUI_006392 [Cystoisospora suis]|uniref:Transmembrane protein n=1 Tax=Cystoisospora suis TaxID=483139 RepID=A0A2C6KQG4_9APIC|nr:hypothetical protein CSUI_006392 [Cystoisospora suis]
MGGSGASPRRICVGVLFVVSFLFSPQNRVSQQRSHFYPFPLQLTSTDNGDHFSVWLRSQLETLMGQSPPFIGAEPSWAHLLQAAASPLDSPAKHDAGEAKKKKRRSERDVEGNGGFDPEAAPLLNGYQELSGSDGEALTTTAPSASKLPAGSVSRQGGNIEERSFGVRGAPPGTERAPSRSRAPEPQLGGREALQEPGAREGTHPGGSSSDQGMESSPVSSARAETTAGTAPLLSKSEAAQREEVQGAEWLNATDLRENRRRSARGSNMEGSGAYAVWADQDEDVHKIKRRRKKKKRSGHEGHAKHGDFHGDNGPAEAVERATVLAVHNGVIQEPTKENSEIGEIGCLKVSNTPRKELHITTAGSRRGAHRVASRRPEKLPGGPTRKSMSHQSHDRNGGGQPCSLRSQRNYLNHNVHTISDQRPHPLRQPNSSKAIASKTSLDKAVDPEVQQTLPERFSALNDETAQPLPGFDSGIEMQALRDLMTQQARSKDQVTKKVRDVLREASDWASEQLSHMHELQAMLDDEHYRWQLARLRAAEEISDWRTMSADYRRRLKNELKWRQSGGAPFIMDRQHSLRHSYEIPPGRRWPRRQRLRRDPESYQLLSQSSEDSSSEEETEDGDFFTRLRRLKTPGDESEREKSGTLLQRLVSGAKEKRRARDHRRRERRDRFALQKLISQTITALDNEAISEPVKHRTDGTPDRTTTGGLPARKPGGEPSNEEGESEELSAESEGTISKRNDEPRAHAFNVHLPSLSSWT